MKFNSILRLSFHNLFNNKLRTVLTVIVLLIMSIVVMVMAAFGISFYASMDKNISEQFQKSGTNFRVNNVEMYTSTSGGRSYQGYDNVEIPIADIKAILEKTDGENGLFAFFKFDSDSYNVEIANSDDQGMRVNAMPFYAKSNSFFDKDNYLEEGRMWNKSDDGTKNIWLSSYYLEQGYKVGDTMSFNFDTLSKFTVCGFLNSDGRDSERQIYFDYSFFNGKKVRENTRVESGNGTSTIPFPTAPFMYITSVDAQFLTQEGFSYGTNVINQLRKASKSISTYEKTTGGLKVDCEIIEMTAMANYVLLGIIGVILFLGVIIILLSIGSVSNTIKITVEQNRKFFGMMKAIGMQDKTVRNVVQWQALLLVIFSVAVASAIVVGLMVAMKGIIASLVTTFFGSTAIVICSLNPAIPFITAFMLVGAVLLSTRKSLNKISKMDVISVISEVN